MKQLQPLSDVYELFSQLKIPLELLSRSRTAPSTARSPIWHAQQDGEIEDLGSHGLAGSAPPTNTATVVSATLNLIQSIL